MRSKRFESVSLSVHVNTHARTHARTHTYIHTYSVYILMLEIQHAFQFGRNRQFDSPPSFSSSCCCCFEFLRDFGQGQLCGISLRRQLFGGLVLVRNGRFAAPASKRVYRSVPADIGCDSWLRDRKPLSCGWQHDEYRSLLEPLRTKRSLLKRLLEFGKQPWLQYSTLVAEREKAEGKPTAQT